MALVNRKKQQQQEPKYGLNSNLNLKTSSSLSSYSIRHLTSRGAVGEYSSFLKNIVLALILSPFVYFAISSNTGLLQQKGSQQSNHIIHVDSSWQIRENNLFAIRIDFDTPHDSSDGGAAAGNPYYSLGPHVVTLNILGNSATANKNCQIPQVWTRIIGDALVNVPLIQMTNASTTDGGATSQQEIWTGQFHVPLAGSYRLEAMYKTTMNNNAKCDTSNFLSKDNKNVKYYYYDFHVMGNAKQLEKKIGDISMVQGSWISTTKIQLQEKDDNHKDVSLLPEATSSSSFPYVWADPIMVEQGKVMTNIYKGNNATKTLMFKESTVTPKYKFYEFQKLSNYELVCWIGSQSAQDIWDSFKTLRRELFPHQRPFKFHYYKATSFVDPDKDWRDNTAFRKCKHILISLDEPEHEKPLSKMEYKEQVTTFIKHLLNAFDEEHTFPALIWMFTTMESVMMDTPHHCHGDPEEENHVVQKKIPQKNKTTRHPCNDVLLDLFQNNSPFPSRVRLLDNTDLTDPIWRQHSGPEHQNGTSRHNGEDADIVAAVTMAIALRIYIIVGHQVKMWRDVGQVGGIDGLTRNGKTEPNFELVRYDWSQTIV
jgi:hypothetical protein